MLVYSICYYYGRNNSKHIINHLNSFNKIKTMKEDIFILNVMVDSQDESIHNKVKDELSHFIENRSLEEAVKYIILTSFNWGGTILGLWMAYKYCNEKYDKNYDDNNIYISHFEEDFCPINNNNWLKTSKNMLNNTNYIYIGESTTGEIKYSNSSWERKGRDFVNSIRLGDPEVWTDGGYYFTNLAKLKLIDEKIGTFHKGDPLTKYKHIKDGIDYGEVGFPTLLYHSKFLFGFLYRHTYFKHFK